MRVFATHNGWLKWAVLLCILISPLAALAADSATPAVAEVYWKDSRSLSLPGVSQVVVVDDSICRAEISGDKITFFGLERGETVAFAWVGSQRVAIRVNVVPPPLIPVPPRLSEAYLQHSAYGTVGSSAQYFNDSSGNSRVFLQNQFSWEQNGATDRLSIRAQANDTLGESGGAPVFNLTTGSIQYARPGFEFNLLDFVLNVAGTGQGSIAPAPNFSAVVLRGADVRLQSGANTYEAFAGTTPSYFYLTLGGTKDVAGFTFSHKQSESLEIYSTIAAVNAPPVAQLFNGRREMSAFETTGLRLRPAEHWLVQASGGFSTEGAMAQGAVVYAQNALTAFAAGSKTSPEFPLNRLQMFFATTASLTSGIRYKFTPRVDGGLYYQHSSGSLVLRQSPGISSDYLNPNLSLVLTRHETATFSYTYSESRGNASTSQQGSLVDLALSSQLALRASNTAQLTMGDLRDPLQLRTASNFGVRDSLTIPFKGQSAWFSFQHQRTSKSLAALLNDQLSLLAPALQQLFLQDPVGFVNSPNLPPDVLAILRNFQPTDTELDVSLQLQPTHKLEFRPNFSYQHSTFSSQQRSSNETLGYALVYRASPSWQVQSALTSMYLYNFAQARFQRTTVFTVGAQKSFRVAPSSILPSRRWHTIQGRVFRDRSASYPGLAGLRVELENGRIATTDAQGRYEFPRVLSGKHTISLPLGQFTHPIRVTTPTLVEVELLDQKVVAIDFGIVDSARLVGTVYNDYTMSGVRQVDAPGMRGIQLILRSANLHRVVTADAAGEFEFADLPAGDYVLTVDPTSVPPNFALPFDSAEVHLDPTSTVVRDIPLRALRSISGRVYLKAEAPATPAPQVRASQKHGRRSGSQTEDSQAEPATTALIAIAGIRIMAGESTATTDAEGRFVLRHLPAGDVEVRLVAAADLPSGMTAPSGHVQMPRDPVIVEGATIVISNSQLVKYLAPAHATDTRKP